MAEKKTFVLRINPDLFETLQRLAAEEFRSVNGQIEFALTQYVRSTGRHPADDASEQTEEEN